MAIYRFRDARTSEEYQQLYALRYQAFCIENTWIAPENCTDEQEKDCYDPFSKHFIAIDDDGDLIGSIRLILSDRLPSSWVLPINNHPSINGLDVKRSRCAEISRLVVDKKGRRGDVALGLYRIMYQYSRDHQIDYWYIVVDEVFLKMLQKLGFPFFALAQAGNYMGETVPARVKIRDVEYNLKKHNPRLNTWFQSPYHTLEGKRLIPKFLSQTVEPFIPTPQSLYSRNWAFIPNSVQKKLANTRMLVAGTGLGSVIAERAVRTGFGKFILADGDIVESSNLNRQMFTRLDLSFNKARVSQKHLLDINDKIEVEVIEEYLTPDTLRDPISRSDLIVNTIDFDHPAFFDCNRQAQEQGKTVFFPLNIGWGGVLLVFSPDSPSLETFLELDSQRSCSFDQIKDKLIRKIVRNNLPDYLLPLFDLSDNPSSDEWINDPQLAVASAISASLVVTAAVSSVRNIAIKTVPEFTYIDFYQELGRNGS